MASNQPNFETHKQIDDILRRVFQGKVEEEVPDRFKDLLAQLQEQDTNKGSGDQK